MSEGEKSIKREFIAGGKRLVIPSMECAGIAGLLIRIVCGRELALASVSGSGTSIIASACQSLSTESFLSLRFASTRVPCRCPCFEPPYCIDRQSSSQPNRRHRLNKQVPVHVQDEVESIHRSGNVVLAGSQSAVGGISRSLDVQGSAQSVLSDRSRAVSTN